MKTEVNRQSEYYITLTGPQLSEEAVKELIGAVSDLRLKTVEVQHPMDLERFSREPVHGLAEHLGFFADKVSEESEDDYEIDAEELKSLFDTDIPQELAAKICNYLQPTIPLHAAVTIPEYMIAHGLVAPGLRA